MLYEVLNLVVYHKFDKYVSIFYLFCGSQKIYKYDRHIATRKKGISNAECDMTFDFKLFEYYSQEISRYSDLQFNLFKFATYRRQGTKRQLALRCVLISLNISNR